jgi:hypothetical protein
VEIESEWATAQTVGSVEIAADDLDIDTQIDEIIFSGWEEISENELQRINNYPCIFIYVRDVSPEVELEQDEYVDVLDCGIKVIDVGSHRDILEKKLYRYTDAIYRVVKSNLYLSGNGWAVSDLSQNFAATEPLEPLVKAGLVSFTVLMPSVT